MTESKVRNYGTSTNNDLSSREKSDDSFASDCLYAQAGKGLKGKPEVCWLLCGAGLETESPVALRFAWP